MDIYEWLEKELQNAQETAALWPLPEQREYWLGYADAITNVMNELYGPGDVN